MYGPPRAVVCLCMLAGKQDGCLTYDQVDLWESAPHMLLKQVDDGRQSSGLLQYGAYVSVGGTTTHSSPENGGIM